MVILTFAEQVKLVLSRRNMTIKQLAEEIEEATGMKMSRQNLTQRLSRDNFQEKDMRMIAEILGCKLHLTILDEAVVGMQAEASVQTNSDEKSEDAIVEEVVEELIEEELIEEALEEVLVDTDDETNETEVEEEVSEVVLETSEEANQEEIEEEVEETVVEHVREVTMGEFGVGREPEQEQEQHEKEETATGEINPYTLREYDTNTVRTHPKRIGYVQVYDREQHGWTEMTEWAYLAYQERQRRMLGKNYQEPIFLD